MDVEALKDRVCRAVDEMRDELLRVSRAIHAQPELAFQEREAAALLAGELEKAGLEVRRVEGAGHFLHQEKPDEVNRILLDWLVGG